MRKQYFTWAWLVLSLVLTIYGGFSLVYNHTHNKEFSILGLVFLIVGSSLLILYLILYFISLFQKDKRAIEEAIAAEEKKEVTQPVKEEKQETSVKEKTSTKTYSSSPSRKEYTYTKSSRDFDGASGYVKLVGYGPILRIQEEEILDMRTNIYYRIEGRMIKQLGSGPIYEIYDNRIKNAFGGYLYEISGDNINKVFGGYYASINGNYIQTFDLKQKYEVPSNLNLKQKLAIAALLFGPY